MSRGFIDAYNKTIGKETKTEQTKTSTSSLSSEDMKAYVDAKFTEMKNSIYNEMKQLINDQKAVSDTKVETPEETSGINADENIEKEGD